MNYAPLRQIRAVYDDTTIRVYQAYSIEIAESAISRGTFVSPPFKMERMTWIKPSFLWMMYRSGWAKKEPGQYRILAIDITKAGFQWAIEHSCLSHPDPDMSFDRWQILKRKSPVRIQWDPERDIQLKPLPWKTIQIGLSAEALSLYVDSWIRKITDATALAHSIHALVVEKKLQEAISLLPPEKPYSHQHLSYPQ
jgi:hypothetical protein